MLVTKKYHLAYVEEIKKSAAEQQLLLRQGYHGRIKALESHISDLEKLVFPSNSQAIVSKETSELDAVISASEKPFEVSEEEQTRILQGSREFDLILSGNYDQDLLG